jgi:hypothetical protein
MFNRQFTHSNKSSEGKEFVIERLSKIRLEKGWMFLVLKIYLGLYLAKKFKVNQQNSNL